MKNNKYNCTIIIKLPEELKQKVIKRSNEKCKNISEYIRDLIVNDVTLVEDLNKN